MDILLLRNEGMTLEKISTTYGVTHQRISQIEKKALKIIILSRDVKLYAGYMEDPNQALASLYEKRKKYRPRKGKKEKEKKEDNMPKKRETKRQTIYDRNSDFTKEQIDEVVDKYLRDDYLKTLNIIFDGDLSKPSEKRISQNESRKYTRLVLPEIRKQLEQHFGKQLKNTDELKPEIVTLEGSITDMKNDEHVETSGPNNNKPEETNKQIETRPEDLARPAFEEKPKQKESTPETGIVEKDNPDMEDNAYVTEAVFNNTRTEQLEEPTSNPLETAVSQGNDWLGVLKLLKTITFEQMMDALNPTQAMIIALKLGYNQDKYYSTEAIARFLDVEETEVIAITKKVLELYKKNITSLLSNTDDSLEVLKLLSNNSSLREC